jgi:hypothetical protein
MREKEGRIPSALSGFTGAVFDGYTNPMETLSHSFVCNPIWLKLFRRRYRRANTDTHYSSIAQRRENGTRTWFFKRRRLKNSR